MENEFKKVMSERTDEELVKIVTVERDSYNPIAIEAAESEIDIRNINTSEFEKIKEKASQEKKQIQTVDSNVVNSATRFLNFIIDSIVWYILIVLVFFIVGLIFPTYIINNNFTVAIINLILIFGTFFAYHSIMEIKFQKTLGKLLTKTRVVKLNGEKPTNEDIISRTFCRFIPFDRISFIFMKNGFHDYLSKTKVVKDTA